MPSNSYYFIEVHSIITYFKCATIKKTTFILSLLFKIHTSARICVDMGWYLEYIWNTQKD